MRRKWLTVIPSDPEARANLELLAKMLGLMNDKRHEVDVKAVVNFTIGRGNDDTDDGQRVFQKLGIGSRMSEVKSRRQVIVGLAEAISGDLVLSETQRRIMEAVPTLRQSPSDVLYRP